MKTSSIEERVIFSTSSSPRNARRQPTGRLHLQENNKFLSKHMGSIDAGC
jgi:hypothetical protein